MDTKEQILNLYYNKHLKQNEIAKIVGKSCPYVSKIVKTDNRNKQEKEIRKKTNAENRKVYLQEYFKTGVVRFELTNDRVRADCLTTWRHPNIFKDI